MIDFTKFYIDGRWVDPIEPGAIELVDPATELVCGSLAVGGVRDVNAAVSAARNALPRFEASGFAERQEMMARLVSAYASRAEDLADAVSSEMGAPIALARQAQVPAGAEHFETALQLLGNFSFEEMRGSTLIRREPIGVCALITPWNWPLNQAAAMLAPALAVGCTVVWKPSELAARSAQILAEIVHDAGFPPGVFNMVHGPGPGVGAALAAHGRVDMVSFTGSTHAGVQVARNAAETVKRVHQELGGKSPNIILDDADFVQAVTAGVRAAMRNSGQTCTAPTRMLVPRARMSQVADIAREAADSVSIGHPKDDVLLGPVVSKVQWERIQSFIAAGVEEGANLVAGGVGRPEGLQRGYYVRPTVFADVENGMRIAREEIFGPVLSIIGYHDDDDAVAIANDSPYGLAAYIQGHDLGRAQSIAARLQAGQVRINAAPHDPMAPFGGYKQSGNGREGGRFGFDTFLETKAIMGCQPSCR
jgi:aldehyde dehydrogenase (NAD+)